MTMIKKIFAEPLFKRNKIIALLICSVYIIPVFAQNITRPNIIGPGGVRANSYTGNMFLQRADLYLAGRMPIDISFSYNSADQNRNMGYGGGWTFNYGMQLKENTDTVTIIRNDGRKDKYIKSTGNSNLFNPPAGIFDSLVKTGTGAYYVRTKEGNKYFFANASTKRLTRQEDRNGNALVFSYVDSFITTIADDAGRTVQLQYKAGKLTSVSEANGSPTRTLTYKYDKAGNLEKVTDPMGYDIGYSYLTNGPMNIVKDKNGNTVDIVYNENFAVKEIISCLTRQTINYSPTTNTTHVTELVGSTNQLTSYKFDASGNLIQKTGNCCGYNVKYEYDKDKNVSKLTDANGNSYTYTYDQKGNMLSETDPLNNSTLYAYEPNYSRVKTMKDKNGNTTLYKYDAHANLIEILKPLSITETFTYANNGDLTSITEGRGNSIKYTYDNNGNLFNIERPLGSTTSFTFDVKGRKLSEKDPLNHTTTYSYDKQNRVIAVTDALNYTSSYSYDANGNNLLFTDANDHTIAKTYDALDRVVKITNADGKSKNMNYNSVGKLTSEIDENHNSTLFFYDELNRLIKKINAANEITSYTFDGNGNLTSIIYPSNSIFSFDYDIANRLIKSHDENGVISTYTYDNNWNKLTETDGNGNLITYNYDALNRRILVTDAKGQSSTVVYDKNSNIIKYTDRNSNSTTFAYDLLNRQTTTVDPLSYSTNYIYDLSNNLIAITDANNHTTYYSLDAANRIISKKYADGNSVIYTYDAVGNIKSLKNENGKDINYTYDKVNRLLSRNYSHSNDVFSYDDGSRMLTANNNNATVSFTYDAANRILSENLNGNLTVYRYNTAEQKKTIYYPSGEMVEENFDQRNRLISIKDSLNVIAEFKYSLNNNIIKINYLNGSSSDITYDGNNRITSIISNPDSFLGLIYEYDNEGNKLIEKKNHRTVSSEQYSYDNLNRLTEFKRGTFSGGNIPSPTIQTLYAYDPLGNRTTVTENKNLTTYTSNVTNAYTDISGLSTINLAYDNSGNLTNDGSFNYSYNENNRLISINNGSIASYQYDALGRRVRKQTTTDSINYYYAGQRIVEERDNRNYVLKTYTYGLGVDNIISMFKNSKRYFYHYNSLNSVAFITDEKSHIIEQYEYDAYGGVSISDSANIRLNHSKIDNHFSFTGREFDEEAGNYYFRLRNYNPKFGRFKQKDPSGYVDGLNLYQFVKNNPLKFVDPNGTNSTNPTCNTFAGNPPIPSESINSCESFYNNPNISKKISWPFKGNAIRACRSTGDDEQMNAIRYSLQQQYLNNNPSNGSEFSAEEHEAFHDNAYQAASCKGKSAGYIAWVGVNNVPIPNDWVIQQSISVFGPCSSSTFWNNGKPFSEKAQDFWNDAIDWLSDILISPAY